MMERQDLPQIRLGIALIPIVFLVTALTVTIKVFELDPARRIDVEWAPPKKGW